MGFLSAIGGFISSCVSAIGSACKAIGGAIMDGIGKLAGAILPHIGTVSDILNIIGQIVGLFNKDDNVENLGTAMRQSDKKPEDFDSINAYVDYLKSEIKAGNINLNEEKTDIQKAVDTALGSGLTIKALDEKYSLKTSAEFWNFTAKKVDEGKLDATDVNSLLKTAGEKKIDVNDVANYVDDKKLESGASKSEISATIKESFKEANPSLSDDDIVDKFNAFIRKD
ncbi:hypothetical protein FQV93_06730 [Campylobacter lari]|uniref:hypothetical protein n=1 Tax=Campylobacter lari TaxID=201 RepID=UPI00126C074E|nr:hypothetical protein [Campylobacter lari]ECK1948380.1 hypothetical protein [Campylobacter lari]EGK8021980.1 hypothetical protein [Campylobacter lari]MBT0818393.1 hypothetical protein [Campylobacter lari]MBT0832863.1 hypothetical protein [Campylobacter lari]